MSFDFWIVDDVVMECVLRFCTWATDKIERRNYSFLFWLLDLRGSSHLVLPGIQPEKCQTENSHSKTGYIAWSDFVRKKSVSSENKVWDIHWQVDGDFLWVVRLLTILKIHLIYYNHVLLLLFKNINNHNGL